MPRFRVVDGSRFSSRFAMVSPTGAAAGAPGAGPARALATAVLERAAILAATEGVRDVVDAADVRDLLEGILGGSEGVPEHDGPVLGGYTTPSWDGTMDDRFDLGIPGAAPPRGTNRGWPGLPAPNGEDPAGLWSSDADRSTDAEAELAAIRGGLAAQGGSRQIAPPPGTTEEGRRRHREELDRRVEEWERRTEERERERAEWDRVLGELMRWLKELDRAVNGPAAPKVATKSPGPEQHTAAERALARRLVAALRMPGVAWKARRSGTPAQVDPGREADGARDGGVGPRLSLPVSPNDVERVGARLTRLRRPPGGFGPGGMPVRK